MNNEENKIPKIIHYVWLGPAPLDKLSQKCMKTWEKILPDYRIIRWDDEKCMSIIKDNVYASEAFEAKKYAFVSDYIRLYALYNYGGVYMDTDVQVIKRIDEFLKFSAFTSFEDESMIPTALMGSEKYGKWVGRLLDYYDNKHFIDSEGNYDFTTNVITITNMSEEFGLIRNGEWQILQDDVHIYPREYFCPLDTRNSKNDKVTENTYAIHLYNGSWTPWYRRIFSKIKKKTGLNVEKILGERLYTKLSNKY